MRDDRRETYNWHFVDLVLAEDRYDAAKHCSASERGDCIVAELEQLKTELRCAPTDDRKRDVLRHAVHFVGDIHLPLHTVGKGRGGNDIAVEVRLAVAKTCRGGPCPIMAYRSTFHRR
ncbi:S1/P1 nuclease [Reyranella sp.]|uniref:S1/P1 nuclease n=1 Tax=Reyranella sp. TaxID=1929291 RepID=UPI003D11C217